MKLVMLLGRRTTKIDTNTTTTTPKTTAIGIEFELDNSNNHNNNNHHQQPPSSHGFSFSSLLASSNPGTLPSTTTTNSADFDLTDQQVSKVELETNNQQSQALGSGASYHFGGSDHHSPGHENELDNLLATNSVAMSPLSSSQTTTATTTTTTTMAATASSTTTFFPSDALANYFKQTEECQSSTLPGSQINCSDSNIYDRMNFCPEEMNFSDFSEVWIRKEVGEILLRVSLVAPILLLGIVGNLTIIYSMCKFKPFRSKPTNIFILNMAVADLLTTIVCPNAALFTDIYQFYVLGSFICRFEGFVKDWLLSVIKPCRTRISIKQSWLALTAIWILAVLMASPLFIWRQLRERQWKDLTEVWCCELIEYSKYYWVVITLFLIYLPIIFTNIVLVIILLQMDKFESKLRRERTSSVSSNSSLSINMRYRRRIVKILVSYLLTSIICWAPLQFTIIYRHFRNEAVPSPWFFQLAFYSQLSASLSAAMNPIIFGFLSQPFRRIVAKSFMFKFLDKMVTTNSRPPTGNNHNNKNNNGNDGAFAMNEMNLKNRANDKAKRNHHASSSRNHNNNNNRSTSLMNPLASQRVSINNHTTNTNHNNTHHINTPSSQQNVNITSFTLTTATTNHHRNSKRVSFNTSASKATTTIKNHDNNNSNSNTDNPNAIRASDDNNFGCDNAGFDPGAQ